MNTSVLVAIIGLVVALSTRTADTCNLTACPNKVDLTFILDSSGSIDAAPTGTWNQTLIWLSEFVAQMAIGPNYVKVAIVNYADNATANIYLNSQDTINGIKSAIMKLQHKSGNTNTASALRFLADEIYREDRGDRPDVKNVGIVITDGYATVDFLDVESAAAYCKNRTTLISVGVSNRTNNYNLAKIASNKQLVLIANSYSMLTTFTNKIMQMVADSLPASAKLEPGAVQPQPVDDRIVIIEGGKGETGDQGEDGAPGAPGAEGEDGKDGEDGETGAVGPQGPQGENGANGQDGVDGIDGDDGSHGHTGHTGPEGPQGVPGPPGPSGEDGQPGAVINGGSSSGSEGHQITVEGGEASVQISGMTESTVIIVSVIGAIATVGLLCGAMCLLIFMKRSKSNTGNNNPQAHFTIPRLTTDCAATQTTVREKKLRGLDNPVVLIATQRESSDNFANHAIASPSIIDITK